MTFEEWWDDFIRTARQKAARTGKHNEQSDYRVAEAAWSAATKAQAEKDAAICRDISYPIDIDTWGAMTKKEHGAYACHKCADAILASVNLPPAKDRQESPPGGHQRGE